MSRPVKGLLMKDFNLMKSQMRFFFIIMIVWGILMASNLDGLFLIGYTAMLCSFMTVSTFSYDELENGMAYLFTLPILRKDYVREKYLFGFLISTLPTILMGVILWVFHSAQGKADHPGEYLWMVGISLPMAYLLVALEIPLIIKFGQEKSRIVSVVLIGCMSAGYGIIQHLDETGAVSVIAGLGRGILVLFAVAVFVGLMLVSCKIACIFMEKKEF